MRMMMKVGVPVEAGNKAVANGTLPKLVTRFIEQHKPEASYFLTEGGHRTALFFFDLDDPSSIPAAAESFFMDLDASIELTPAMSAEELKAGVQRAMKHH